MTEHRKQFPSHADFILRQVRRFHPTGRPFRFRHQCLQHAGFRIQFYDVAIAYTAQRTTGQYFR
ncbi:hypothetical protein D3C81_2328600 [compost metagenome]